MSKNVTSFSFFTFIEVQLTNNFLFIIKLIFLYSKPCVAQGRNLTESLSSKLSPIQWFLSLFRFIIQSHSADISPDSSSLEKTLTPQGSSCSYQHRTDGRQPPNHIHPPTSALVIHWSPVPMQLLPPSRQRRQHTLTRQLDSWYSLKRDPAILEVGRGCLHPSLFYLLSLSPPCDQAPWPPPPRWFLHHSLTDALPHYFRTECKKMFSARLTAWQKTLTVPLRSLETFLLSEVQIRPGAHWSSQVPQF